MNNKKSTRTNNKIDPTLLVEQASEEELSLQKKKAKEEALEEKARLLRKSLVDKARAMGEIGVKSDVDPLPGAEIVIEDIQRCHEAKKALIEDEQRPEWNGDSMSALITVIIGGNTYNLGRMNFTYGDLCKGKWGAKINIDPHDPTMAQLRGMQGAGRIKSVDKVLKKIEHALNEAVPMEFGFDQVSADHRTKEGRDIMRRLIEGETPAQIQDSNVPASEMENNEDAESSMSP